MQVHDALKIVGNDTHSAFNPSPYWKPYLSIPAAPVPLRQWSLIAWSMKQ
jgi:hypothetical protein